MKRIFSLTLALLMAFSLFACGKEKEVTRDGKGESIAATTPKNTAPELFVPDTHPSTEEQIPDCTKLSLSISAIEMIYAGEEWQLKVRTEPIGYAYDYSFFSDDPTVATVDKNGKITAVSRGVTTIYVTCGYLQSSCIVICNFEESPAPTEPDTQYKKKDLTLYCDDCTFPLADKSFKLYTGNIPAQLVTFKSNDESVAAVDENGVITFLSAGRAIITATYGEWTVEAIVRIQN